MSKIKDMTPIVMLILAVVVYLTGDISRSILMVLLVCMNLITRILEKLDG